MSNNQTNTFVFDDSSDKSELNDVDSDSSESTESPELPRRSKTSHGWKTFESAQITQKRDCI